MKRTPLTEYRAQKRGGRGKTGAATKEDDFVTDLFVASTHAYLMPITTKGKLYWLKVHEIPQAGRTARGKAIVNLVQLAGEKATRSCRCAAPEVLGATSGEAFSGARPTSSSSSSPSAAW